MAHELELFRNGDAAFYSARESAWHRLGTVTPDALTIPDALEVSHLGGWDLQKQPIGTVAHDGTAIEVPGKYAVVRRHPDPELAGTSDVLGVVGEDYTIVQNEEAFSFLGGLVDGGEVTIETAGSLRGGRRVFVTMKLIAANFLPLDNDASEPTKRRVEQKRDDLRVLFRDAPTQEVGRGTKWAAYNAISEWTEWVAPRNNAAERSAESVLMGKAAGTRQKAWNLLAPAWATG